MAQRRSAGFSLTELLISVAIASLIGLVALWTWGGGNDTHRLEAAATQVAAALRFAQGEARRTGTLHGTRLTASSDRIRVFELDTSSDPPKEKYTIYHPTEHRLYDVYLGGAQTGADVTPKFVYGADATIYEAVAFTATGAGLSPKDLRLLKAGAVTLRSGDQTTTLTLDPTTGRVTRP